MPNAMMVTRSRRALRSALPLVLIAVVGVLTALPLVMLAYSSFRTTAPGQPGELTVQGYVNAYTDPRTYETFANSFLLATQVTILSTLMAVFFAWAVARTDMPGRRAAVPLMALIYAMPTIFFALGWAMLGNPRAGLLNHLVMGWLPLESPPFNTNSWGGMVFVMVLTAVPFKFLLLLGAFRAMDISLEESSRMAGAGKTRTLFFIGLPILAPIILGVMILGFVRAIQSLEVPLFLGFPAEIYVFSTRIYDYIANRFPPRYAEAGALAIALVFTMVALIICPVADSRETRVLHSHGQGLPPGHLAAWPLALPPDRSVHRVRHARPVHAADPDGHRVIAAVVRAVQLGALFRQLRVGLRPPVRAASPAQHRCDRGGGRLPDDVVDDPDRLRRHADHAFGGGGSSISLPGSPGPCPGSSWASGCCGRTCPSQG